MTERIEMVIAPRERDLGGFSVRRVLPHARRRGVGPFVFFDHLGPVNFPAGRGIDVRPHPHIGLATVTYLFAGEIVHRDSLGYVQPIRPGDVNWMTAGRGIVHSERTGADVRAAGGPVHGIQSWVGLPRSREEDAPSFVHHPGETLPAFELDGVGLTLIAGRAYGRESPVVTASPMFYLDARIPPGLALELEDAYEDRALYVAEGEVDLAGRRLSPGEMAVLAPGRPLHVHSAAGARLMLLGGDPLDGSRIIWWNFVSSSRARIEQAKRDWAEGRFSQVPGETEFIPLPED